MARKEHSAAAEHQHGGEAQHETVTQAGPEGHVSISVGPLTLSVPRRYAAGHVLTPDEANALDQLIRENLRNNFRTTVTKALEGAKKEGRESLNETETATLTADFEKRVSEYSFASQRGPRAPSDPVGREAHKIAKGVVLAALAKRKVDVKALPEGKMDELIAQALEKYPQIKAEAERRVSNTKNIADELLGSDVAA